MSVVNLIVNGIEIPVASSETINHIYTPIVAETLHRMSNGDAVKQQSWGFGKTKIQTSGTGKIPLALQMIDYSKVFVIACASPLMLYSPSNLIILPADRRLDVDVVGYAIIKGQAQRTAVMSVVADTATLNAKAGASGYQIAYFPKYIVFGTRPTETDSSRTSHARSWSFTCEEK